MNLSENTGTCIWGCRKPVVWARTWKLDEVKKAGEKPGKMPLDPGQRPAHDTYANIAVSGSATGAVLARVLSDGEEPMANEVRYVTHFATCTHYSGQAPVPDGVTRLPGAASRRVEQPAAGSASPTVGGTVLVLESFRRRPRRGVPR